MLTSYAACPSAELGLFFSNLLDLIYCTSIPKWVLERSIFCFGTLFEFQILYLAASSWICVNVCPVFLFIAWISSAADGDSFQVTDACTACFEQRTVFTQQVLEKSLNQLVHTLPLLLEFCVSLFSSCLISWTVLQVDRIPIPLLFMRTVIQALDAFPALVCWFLFWVNTQRILSVYICW